MPCPRSCSARVDTSSAPTAGRSYSFVPPAEELSVGIYHQTFFHLVVIIIVVIIIAIIIIVVIIIAIIIVAVIIIIILYSLVMTVNGSFDWNDPRLTPRRIFQNILYLNYFNNKSRLNSVNFQTNSIHF